MNGSCIHNRRIIVLVMLLLWFVFPATAQQQVGFGLYTDEDLELVSVGPETLEFGPINSGAGTFSIELKDAETAIFKITGVEYLDVTVTITPPDGNVLLLEGNQNTSDPVKTLPVAVKMAYYNLCQPNIDDQTAKDRAIEITGHMATFQICRRPGGPPGPPPTPPHSGYKPPKGNAFLFVYGDLTAANVHAGNYFGTIRIDVEYSTY